MYFSKIESNVNLKFLFEKIAIKIRDIMNYNVVSFLNKYNNRSTVKIMIIIDNVMPFCPYIYLRNIIYEPNANEQIE